MPSELFKQLLHRNEMHLRKCKNHINQVGYKLYTSDMKPIRFFKEQELKDVLPLLKRDKKGKLSLNFQLIRKLHGNDGRKWMYKKLKSTTA